MKKPQIYGFFASLFITIFAAQAFAQTPNEKLLATIPASNSYTDAYSFKYSPNTNAWVYASYDTTARMYTLITSKGTSRPFSYVMQYSTLFDFDGNSYTIAGESATDTSSNYYILKNNEVVSPAYG